MRSLFYACGGARITTPCVLAAGLFAPAESTCEPLPEYVPRADAARGEVPETYRWDLSHLFADIAAWDKARQDLQARLGELDACRGRVARDADSFGRCLDLVFELAEKLDRLAAYARLDYATDRTRGEAKVRTDQADTLLTRFNEARSFVEPELLAADPERLRSFVRRPGLEKYAHYVDDLIRRRAHVLSPDQERILAMTGDVLAAGRFILSGLEEDVVFPPVVTPSGEEVALTRASFPRLRAHESRAVREEAVRKFFSTLGAFARSFAAVLDLTVKGNILDARARRYASALEASLDRNAVPVAVYDQLLAVTAQNLPETLHRYVRLRQRLLGVEAVHYHDLYVPLFPSPHRDIPFPRALDMVRQAMKPLGSDYMEVLSTGLDPANRWMDAMPNKGKRSGAFCNATYRDHPMVFLNYMGEIEDVFTLAHEFGHAMHFWYSHRSQEYVNADAPIFLAEVASTFHEEMLLYSLLQGARSREERLFLLTRRLESLRTTVFRQVMFAEFERDLYRLVEEGGAVTAEALGEMYASLVRKYYGPNFTIGQHDRWEWAYIPHFHYNFYVFQYATGLMSAIALATRVQAREPGAAERYLDFLRAGGSDYPVETLRRAGVDLTRPEAMQATFDLFRRTLEEVEALTLGS